MLDDGWGPWITHIPGLVKHRLAVIRTTTNIIWCKVQVEPKLFRFTKELKLAVAEGPRSYASLCNLLIATEGKDTAAVFKQLGFTEDEHLFLTTGKVKVETL